MSFVLSNVVAGSKSVQIFSMMCHTSGVLHICSKHLIFELFKRTQIVHLNLPKVETLLPIPRANSNHVKLF